VREGITRRALLLALAGLSLLSLAPPAAVQARAADRPFILGRMIRQAKVEGYFVHYHLLDRKERDQLLRGLDGEATPGVDASGRATHHLMVYLWGPDGRFIPSAKVRLRITAPDGRTVTTPTVSMQDGHGADVVLPVAGKYDVVMEADVGAKALTDEFSFDLK